MHAGYSEISFEQNQIEILESLDVLVDRQYCKRLCYRLSHHIYLIMSFKFQDPEPQIYAAASSPEDLLHLANTGREIS